MANRLAGMGVEGYRCIVNTGGWNSHLVQVRSALHKPRHWRKHRRIFVCSMGDLFHEYVPFNWQYDVFRTMGDCPQHTFMILTKRAERMLDFFLDYDAPDNLGLGVTVENQKMANERIPSLIETPAAWRFVSGEPTLGPVEIAPWWLKRLSWVICGGESGHGARPMHPDWVRGLRDQCVAADVPFWFKQWGEWLPYEDWRLLPPEDGEATFSEAPVAWVPYDCNTHDGAGKRMVRMVRVGKRRAGHLLDGQEWRQIPEVAR